ncbi:nucleoside hydrolase [Phototrophicus methaneseepsis]|uniref:Nucleoside hydrolase n=1 Tax=Phototrophicus methaneseepsis TaxID=2710758 RepID=A0A7S8E8M1_9CHLR|nr:nucleoside hydrolase [Phototrophicus methaneseepsis]QPC82264.1 nucleoside hydrolase [Phototrophicus methaneseepsis]
MPQKIIIDTDPGVDDTMAIYYALESGAFDILGLTTVFGNVETPLATLNALRLLEIAGRTDIPVAQGATRPFAEPYFGAPAHIHGADGQGDLFLPAPSTQAISLSAAQFIVDQIMAQPGEVTLVPLGPLTNIAMALLLEPQIAQAVKQVVLMGGAAFVPGNITPAAEANIFHDAIAAEMVLSAPWDVTMIGLDVTHQVIMSDEELGRYGASAKATSQHISKVLPLYINFTRESRGKPGLYTHDPTTISYLLNPALFEVQPYLVRVETEGFSIGKTWAWPQNVYSPLAAFQVGPEHLVNVVLGADVPAVNAMMLATV